VAKKTYTVTGNTPYMDHQPGETFEAELDPEQEERALERGAIEVGKKSTGKEAKDA